MVQLGFPDSSIGKESACSAEDPGSIPRLEDPLEKGKGSCLTYFKAQILTLPCIKGSKFVCL